MSELWRVQGMTGAVRLMSLDDIDRAFNAGYLHAGTNVLAPGSLKWQTLGEAAGLDEVVEQTPSLSPMAIGNSPASYELPPFAQQPVLTFDDVYPAKKSRKLLVFGVVAAAVCALSVIAGNARVTHSTTVIAAAPPRIETVLPPPAAEQPPIAAPKQGLTEEMKQRLLDADKAKSKKVGKGKHRLVRTQDENNDAHPIPKTEANPLVEGGDKFDPLNGSL